MNAQHERAKHAKGCDGNCDHCGDTHTNACLLPEVSEHRECLYPGCECSRRTRGLCHSHYQLMRSRVRAGRVTEEELMARGLLLKSGTGGSPARDVFGAFEAGSPVRGDG